MSVARCWSCSVARGDVINACGDVASVLVGVHVAVDVSMVVVLCIGDVMILCVSLSVWVQQLFRSRGQRAAGGKSEVGVLLTYRMVQLESFESTRWRNF